MGSFAPGTGLGAHLFFLALLSLSALAVSGAVLTALVRKAAAGTSTRLFAATGSLCAAAAVLVAASAVPGLRASPWGLDPASVVAGCALALGFASTLLAWSAAEPRVAALTAATMGLTCTGMLIQLLLTAAAPDADAAVAWELRRLSTMCTFAGIQAALVSAIGFSISLRPAVAARPLHISAFILSLGAVSLGSSLVGGGSLREAAVVGVLLVPTLIWIAWCGVRARPPLPAVAVAALRANVAARSASGLDRVASMILSSQRAARASLARFAGAVGRLPERPSVALFAGLATAVLSITAVLFAGGGSARDAARVDVGGLAFTPALLVPFAFAPALGLLLGSHRLRARGLWGLLLTALVSGLLVAQKEIGYTGVVLAIAAVAFLTARGTLLHLAAAVTCAAGAMGLAFELQPVLPWIPFTVRERVLLWLGGAGFFRRGGHLLAADRVTYDLGGVWGLGVHTHPSLDLHRTVNSLDTDFPLATVGLFGGLPWLLTTITLIVAFTVVLYDITRRQGRRGSLATGRWRLPVMAGLATVPVASSAINLSGGLTHISPFAGVPVAFLSYGSFFMAGLLLILILFLVAGSEAALADRLRPSSGTARRLLHPGTPALRRDDPPDAWWRNPRWPGIRLAIRRLSGRMRLASVDAGALMLILGVIVVGLVWGDAVRARYTRRVKVHVHPALVDSVRIRPLTPGVWEVTSEGLAGWRGILEQGRTYRLDPLELRHTRGRLDVVGACLPRALAEARPLRIGFEGLVLPRLAGFGETSRDVARELGATLPEGNDLVLPLAPIWLRHLDISPVGEGRYRVSAATPGARFMLYDERGTLMSRPRGGSAVVGVGWTVALAEAARLHFRIEEGVHPLTAEPEICLRNSKDPMFSWELSRWRDTEVGGLDLLRSAPVEQTVDFEFAEDLKRASEAGLVGMRPDGGLWITPWANGEREHWDPLSIKRFGRIFRVRTGRDGKPELHWVRGFYRDGSTRVRLDPDWEAFAAGWEGELLGLRDPFRFARALPDVAAKKRDSERGRLLDAKGRPLARLEPGGERWDVEVPEAGALIGWGYPKRGVWGGLLRVFRRLLMGRRIRPAGADDELTERVLERDGAEVGADVLLTLDRDVQIATQAAVDTACERMLRKALDEGDLEWKPHGRALVLGPEGEVVAAASCPSFGSETLTEVLDAVRKQRSEPMSAPGLDAWQRTTTVGLTAKVGLVVAASQDPSANFMPYGEDELCIRAEDDPANERGGCFVEKGALTSFRGEAIEPVRNYGGAFVGGVTTLTQLLVKSVNTASSYLAGRLRLAGIRDFYELLEVTRPYDLLPERIGLDPRFSADIERWPGDTLTAWRARLGEFESAGDAWRTSYDVRLGLSGFTDFSILHVAMATSIAARDGRHYRPFLVRGLRDLADGQLLSVAARNPLQVIPVRMARHIKAAMVRTVAYGTAASLRRMAPREIWEEMGGKTGTGETSKLQRGAAGKPSGRRKPKTEDHKFFAGFWPASSRNPYVIVTGFEHVSHLDTRVALQIYADIVTALVELEQAERGEATDEPER